MKYPGKLLKEGDRGPDVLAIQQRLGVQQTGLFGPTTEECVTAFQRAHGLDPDGIVGPKTWAALFAVERPSTDLGEVALSIARKNVGVRERPAGSNRGPEVDRWLRLAGVPESEILAGRGYWCAAFVNAMVDEAAKSLRIANPIPRGGAKFSCSALYQWGRVNKRLVSRPEPGDIFLCIGGPSGHFHTGLVVALLGDGRFSTIEGNSNDDGSANGVEVAYRPHGRRLASCHYVRL